MTATQTSLTVHDAEGFLFREARLLDERLLDQWEELFTDDAVYWIPLNPELDPRESISIAFDDRKRLHERVYRLMKTPVLDQNPASRTVRFVSNIEVERSDGEEWLVRCNQMIAEIRPGGLGQVGLNVPRVIAARCLYHLRAVDGEWRIARKHVFLLDADQAQFNLSFVV